jgi:uncharacterized protein (DUF488 family)
MSNAIIAARQLQGRTTSAQLYTIGYEGLNLPEFVERLDANGIAAIIDVRRNPISRKKGFSKRAFSERLRIEGIEYFHLPNLGIASNLRKNLDTWADYAKLFAFYKSELLPEAMAEVERIQFLLRRFRSVALLCFERDHEYCHRGCLAAFAFEKSLIGDPAIHL